MFGPPGTILACSVQTPDTDCHTTILKNMCIKGIYGGAHQHGIDRGSLF